MVGREARSSQHLRLGILESRKGDVTRARRTSLAPDRSIKRQANFEGLAEVTYQDAYTATTSGRLNEARAAAEKSLQLAEQIRSIQLQIRALGRLSAIETTATNYDRAKDLAASAIRLAQDSGSTYWAADGILRWGSVYFAQRQYEQAEPIFERGLKLAKEGQMPPVEANLEMSLARIRAQQRNLKESTPLTEAALAYYRANGSRSRPSKR